MEPGLRVDYAKAPKLPLSHGNVVLIWACTVFAIVMSFVWLTPQFHPYVIAIGDAVWMIPTGLWIDRRKPPPT